MQISKVLKNAKRTIRIAVQLFIIGLSILLIITVIRPKSTTRYVRDIIGLTCWDYKQAVYSKKLTNIVPEYIAHSQQTGIKKCKNEKEVKERAEAGKLVKIIDGKGFSVDELSHSYPYLTKNAKALLIEISERFRKKISGTRLKGASFRVTSLTRTTEKLSSLRGVNSNASLNSPHLYGNAFDISYIKFSTRKFFMTNCDEKYLMEALAEVIYQLKKERKCWATFEKQQNCFHVVAR